MVTKSKKTEKQSQKFKPNRLPAKPGESSNTGQQSPESSHRRMTCQKLQMSVDLLRRVIMNQPPSAQTPVPSNIPSKIKNCKLSITHRRSPQSKDRRVSSPVKAPRSKSRSIPERSHPWHRRHYRNRGIPI